MIVSFNDQNEHFAEPNQTIYLSFDDLECISHIHYKHESIDIYNYTFTDALCTTWIVGLPLGAFMAFENTKKQMWYFTMELRHFW